MPEKKEQHESLTRLLEAAHAVAGRKLSKSDLARELDELPQTITNWGARGVSTEGALKAEVRYRTRAAYILGMEDASRQPTETAVVVSPIRAVTISGNLDTPEARFLVRLLAAAPLPGVVVEVIPWTEGPQEPIPPKGQSPTGSTPGETKGIKTVPTPSKRRNLE